MERGKNISIGSKGKHILLLLRDTNNTNNTNNNPLLLTKKAIGPIAGLSSPSKTNKSNKKKKKKHSIVITQAKCLLLTGKSHPAAQEARQ